MSREIKTAVLTELEAIIAERAVTADGKSSYTASLLEAGTEKCARKFGEEAIELIMASMNTDRHHMVAETADVLYHLMVLLRSRDIELDSVMDELLKRFAQSGLQEKASRLKG